MAGSGAQPLTRTLDPGITYFSAAEIRVVLLPIGDIPNDVFEHYASMVMAHRQVELSNVRSFYKASQKSPFKFFPWKTGHLHFRFLPEGAAPPSPLASLHAHRRVLGVLGIMSCAHDPDVARRYADFEARCRSFPDAATVRCLAFDPPTDEAGLPLPAAAEDTRSRPDLIVFPPGQDADHLGNHLEVVLHDYAACVLGSLEAWMLNASPAAASLSTLIDTPEFTAQAAAPYAGEDDAGRTKRKYARVQKAMGDYSLLAGSPLDAVDHYNTAAELGRAGADWTVAAAAMEGYGAAKLLHAATEGEAFVSREDSVFREDRAWRERGSPARRRASGEEAATPGGAAAGGEEASGAGAEAGEEGDGGDGGGGALEGDAPPFERPQFWAALRRAAGLEEEVRLLVEEAKAAIRRRGGLPLLVEADLRWARLLAGLHGPGARGEVAELANAVQMAAELLPLPEDRLVALTEAAAVLGAVGAGRKRVLLMWQAVELSKYFGFPDARTLEVARAALEPAAAGGGAAWPAPRRPLAQDTAVPASWGPVRAGCLEATLGLAIYAKRHGDVWDAAAALLRDHAPLLSRHRMASLMDNMAAAASQMSPAERARPGRGPPPLLLPGAPRPPAPPLAPVWLEDAGGAASVASPLARHSVFLYDPFSAKRRQQRALDGAGGGGGGGGPPEWVCGEPGAVDIEVANPTSVSIKIDKMVLEGTFLPADAAPGAGPAPAGKAAWKGKPVSLNIPAHTKPVRIQLEGTPLTPGTLVLTGCRLTAFGGVSWSQPWAGSPPALAAQLAGAWKRAEPAGGGGAGKGMAVKVLPPLPRLTLALTAAGGPAPALRLLQGQAAEAKLVLTNVGALPIDALRVGIGSSGGGAAPGQPAAPPSKVAVDVDTETLEAALPLAPGASVALPVRFSAPGSRPAAGGGAPAGGVAEETVTETLAVEYSAGHAVAPSYAAAVSGGSPAASRQVPGRRASLAVAVAVAPSLLLSRVDFEPVYVAEGAGECAPRVMMTAEVVNRGRQGLQAWLAPTAGGELESPAAAAVGPGQRAKLAYLLAAGDGAALSAEEEEDGQAAGGLRGAPAAAALGAGRRPSGPVRYEERERQGCAAALAHRVCLRFSEVDAADGATSDGPAAAKAPGCLPLVHGEVYNGLTPATLCMLRSCAVAARLIAEPLGAPGDAPAPVALPVGSSPFVCPALRVGVGQPVRLVLEARSLVDRPLDAFCSLAATAVAPTGDGPGAPGAEPLSPGGAPPLAGASPVLAGLGSARAGGGGGAPAAWAGAHSQLRLALPPRGTVRHVAGVALATPGVFRLGTGPVGLTYGGAAEGAAEGAEGAEEGADGGAEGALGQNTLVNVEPAFLLVEQS